MKCLGWKRSLRSWSPTVNDKIHAFVHIVCYIARAHWLERCLTAFKHIFKFTNCYLFLLHLLEKTLCMFTACTKPTDLYWRIFLRTNQSMSAALYLVPIYYRRVEVQSCSTDTKMHMAIFIASRIRHYLAPSQINDSSQKARQEALTYASTSWQNIKK